MGIHPFAALSAVERSTYRTALIGHVVEVMYRAWQCDTALHVDTIVAEVQAVAFDAPFVEIHRTVALMECGGLIRQDRGRSGLWVWLETPHAPIAPLEFCATPGCLRPAGHLFYHLPDLHGLHLSTELVVRHEDFVAAWAPGSAWVRLYPDAAAWAAHAEPRTILAAPHAMPYTPAALAAVVTAWLGHDEHPGPADPPFVFEMEAATGTLHHCHPEFFAVWERTAPTIEIYTSRTDWAHGKDPVDKVDVAHDAPFTGLVLAQAAEDWLERTHDNHIEPDRTEPAQPLPDRNAMPDSAAEPEHPNAATRAYLRQGLPATLPEDMRVAWERHLAGEAVPLRLLPTNGDCCAALTHSGSPAGCGFSLLIDGSCPNASAHTDEDDTDPEGADGDTDGEARP